MERRKRMQFWGRNREDDSLVREIIAGVKTATACKAEEYPLSDGEYDDGNWQIGELVDVYDLKQQLRCVIRITDLYETSFGAIPEKLYRGEGYGSAEEFQADHRYCWPDYELSEDFQIMVTHFELVEVVRATA